MTDNAAEKNDSTATEEIDEILDNIKETMNSDEKPNEDVLELTEKIDSKDKATSSEAANDEPATQLDNILADDKKENTGEPAASKETDNDVMDKIDGAHTEQTSSTPAESKVETSSAPTQQSTSSALLHNDIANESRKALKNLIEKTEQDDSLRINRDTTLEELTKELLKPQLSEWLNNNLQAIVEKVVQKEIRKILPND